MSWKQVCTADEISPNSLKKFEVDDISLIVANVNGEYSAFPPFCPHMEEPLATSGMLVGTILVCSKHLWQWDLKTGQQGEMTEKPLLMYEVKKEGSEILVNLEKELTYDYDEEEDDTDDDDFFN